ncbi:MAG TPA: hypothetical protein VNH44_03450, partial [Micropepsaceae bacterium]|nr:hypothetical protein [Micropepsaceae bacterium]
MKYRVLLSGAIGVAVAGAPALADDLTISTSTTAAVATATAANSTPGNITISNAGSVALTATGVAVSLNSNNSVSNSGTISNNADSSAVGVQISGSNTGSFTNAGIINILGTAKPSTAGGQFGVLLNGTGAFTGNIVATSVSSITVTGVSANAVAVETELNGNLTLGGSVTASGSASNGVITSGLIDGAFTNTGMITTTRQATETTVNPGSAVAIGANIAGGFLNAGPITSTDTTAVGIISTVGTSPALIVAPSIGLDASNIALGVLSDVNTPGYSLVNRGKITSTGDRPSTSATTIQIGDASDNTSGKLTGFSGGFYNSGAITAVATSDLANTASLASNATAIIIANGATVPLLTNAATGTISATTGGELGGNTVAVSIQSGGSLTTLNNAGTIASSANLTATAVTSLTAYAIQDASGKLTQITNSGTISATTTVLNNGAQKAVAADLSLATTAINFTNSGTVTGDILFGKGAGSQLTIEGAHAVVAGNIQAVGTGVVNIAVSAGGTGGTLQSSHVTGVGTLTVGPQGTLNLGIGANNPVVSATGAISFDAL